MEVSSAVISTAVPYVFKGKSESPAPTEKKSLKNRCCVFLRAAPATGSLLASTIGVICALIWHCPYLSIAFAAGAFCSVYAIWISLDYSNQKAFSENLDLFLHHLKSLATENTQYHQLNNQLQSKINAIDLQITRLRENVILLKGEKEDFHAENKLLKETEQKLTQQVDELTIIRDTIATKAQQTTDTLSLLNDAFSKVGNAVNANHQVFDESAALIRQGMQAVKENTKKFGEKSDAIAQQMTNQVDLLLPVLKDLCERISKWMNTETVKNELEKQKLAQQLNQDLQANLTKLQKEAELARGQSESLTKQVNELERVKDQLYKDMQSQLSEFRNNNKQLHETNTLLNANVRILAGHVLGQNFNKDEILKAANYVMTNVATN